MASVVVVDVVDGGGVTMVDVVVDDVTAPGGSVVVLAASVVVVAGDVVVVRATYAVVVVDVVVAAGRTVVVLPAGMVFAGASMRHPVMSSSQRELQESAPPVKPISLQLPAIPTSLPSHVSPVSLMPLPHIFSFCAALTKVLYSCASWKMLSSGSGV